MESAEAARRAADVIRERGHAKSRLEDDEGRVCFSGAVRMALMGNPRSIPGYHGPVSLACRTIFCAAEKVISCNPVMFNDAPETTAEDVIYLLELTAKEIEAAHG